MRTFARTTPLLSLALLTAACVAGCFGSSGSPPPDGGVTGLGDSGTAPAAGGTGAFGIVTIAGPDGKLRQKMYLPQTSTLPNGDAFITVVDVGAGPSGAPAQVASIDLGSPMYATATGGDDAVVIAVSTDNRNVYFINPKTDTLTNTIQLDASYGQSSFSGGGGYVTGVAIDSASNRAILSVWNGFALVDLSSQTITTVIQTPPTENFGFDSVHQRLIAPFYDCSSSMSVDPDSGATLMPSSCSTPMLPEGGVITDGLNIVDLTDNTVYTYEPPPGGIDAGPFFAYDPTQPVGGEPDSAAADPTTGIVVVPSEGGGWQNVIDLSKATFDKSSRTVTAPLTVLPTLDYDAVAVEPNRHLAFWEQEFDDTVAVADLNAANMGSTNASQGEMPNKPDMTGFENLGDPHGIAVTTALATSGPVGFVVDSQRQWVARIDLAAMLAAGEADGSAMLSQDMMAPFVTYLDALTPEPGSPAAAEAGTEGGADADLDAGDDGNDDAGLDAGQDAPTE
jgi:hypothetical protein